MKSPNCNAIIAILETYYPTLPTLIHFRGTFQLLISVVLTANTTDAQVNKVTPHLFARYPNAHSMAQCPDPRILEALIRSVGLAPTKARHIHRISRILVETYRGEVPLEFDKLVALPGVGRKSASVLMCRAAKRPAIIVDTHFARVVGRIGCTGASSPRAIEEDIKRLVAEKKWCSFSQRINVLGRELCTARTAYCPRCPIQAHCQFAARTARNRLPTAAQ